MGNKQSPRTFEVNLSDLSESEKQVVKILKKAGYIIQDMWNRQYDKDNEWCNCYQKGLTKEEIAEAAKTNPDILSPYTAVIKNEEGKIVPLPYEEYCKQSFEEIIALLNEAAEITEDKNQSEYLEALADSYKNGDFMKALIAYVTKPETKIEVLMGPISSYQDKLFGIKKSFQFNLRVLCEPDTEELHEMLDIVKKLSIIKPIKTVAQKLETEKISTSVWDVLMFAGRQATSCPSSTNLPNEEELIMKHGTKIIFYKNAMDKKTHRLIRDYFKYFTHELKAEEENFKKAYFRLVGYHEITEATIKYPNMVKRLESAYDFVKEANAFQHGIRSAGLHLLNGHLSPKEYQKIIIMLALYGLDSIKRRKEDSSICQYAKGFIITFNYGLKNDVIEIKNNKLKLKMENMSKMSEIAKIFHHLLAEGTEKQALALLEKYGDFNKIDNVLKSS